MLWKAWGRCVATETLHDLWELRMLAVLMDGGICSCAEAMMRRCEITTTGSHVLRWRSCAAIN